MNYKSAIKFTSMIVGFGTITACTHPSPNLQTRLVDTWGKRLYPTTNMDAVYPPRGGIFPGDVVALCSGPVENPAVPQQPSKEKPQAISSAEGAAGGRLRFDPVIMGRFSTFNEFIYEDLRDRPHFKQSAPSPNNRMSISFGSREIALPTVAFPTSSFVSQSNIDVGLAGTVDAVKGGVGASRSNTAYYILSIPNAGLLALPYPLARAAISQSLAKDPQNAKMIEDSFKALKGQDWNCELGLFAVWKVYYAREMVYSYGETLAQAFSAQAQVFLPEGTRSSATNEQIKSAVPKPATADGKQVPNTTTPDDPMAGIVTAVSTSRSASANAAMSSSDLGVQGGRATVSNAYDQGVAFRYKYEEPLAIAVSYIKLNVEKNDRIGSLEITPPTGNSTSTLKHEMDVNGDILDQDIFKKSP